MTSDVFTLLLDNRVSELSDKAVESGLSRAERVELKALTEHQDKAPAVVHRIRILASKLAQKNQLGLWLLRFSKQCKQNLAELEALIHYGQSRAVWEIAYLYRKQAGQKLTDMEKSELEYLTLYHDSPDVMRITELKLKADFGNHTSAERQELAALQRNLYRDEGIPSHLMEMLWPSQRPMHLDLSQIS
ncbi:MAG: hypothetical protein K0Q50_2416 [Vampirovibrio sp.]|jgi:uncharacterized protein YnzC (UPF0291/DUF896 family)|nr:hypothetical protein [Vampirovibrio sp.]